MINLAGDKAADECIQEELFLAGIPQVRVGKNEGEVPYTLIGKLGDWEFTRGWSYWMAGSKSGLPSQVAVRLHEQEYPIVGGQQPKTYGQVVRVNGDGTAPRPTQEVYSYHIDTQLGLIELARLIRLIAPSRLE